MCDRNGCSLNPNRVNSKKDFYGENKAVNTLRPFRVYPQFNFNNNSDKLSSVQINYAQDRVRIKNPTDKNKTSINLMKITHS